MTELRKYIDSQGNIQTVTAPQFGTDLGRAMSDTFRQRVRQDDLEDASFGELFGATARDINLVANSLGAMERRSARIDDAEAKEEWDLYDFKIANNLTDQEAQYISKVKGKNEANTLLKQIRKRQEDELLIAANPIKSIPAYLASGLLDAPTALMGAGVGIRIGQGSVTAAKVGAGAAIEGFAYETGAEALLQAVQPERTIGESIVNVTGATALSGIMGGLGAKWYLNRYGSSTNIDDMAGEAIVATARAIEQKHPYDMPTTVDPLKTAKSEVDEVVDGETPVQQPEGTPQAAGASVNIAETKEGMQIAEPTNLPAKLVFKAYQKTFGKVAPGVRAKTGGSKEQLEVANKLVRSPFATVAEVETGISRGASVEHLVDWDVNTLLPNAQKRANNILNSYYGAENAKLLGNSPIRTSINAKVAGKKSPAEIRRLVGKAMVRGDSAEEIVSDVQLRKVVEDIAKAYRDEIYEPMRARLIKAELLDEDATVDTAISYLNRVYKQKEMLHRREDFMSAIDQWARGTVRGGVDSAEELLREGVAVGAKADELRSYLRAVKDDVDGFNDEVTKLKNQVYDKIMAFDNNVNTFSQDLRINIRGPLKDRTFSIPDKAIEDFLEKDIDLLSQRFVRVTAAEHRLKEAFGEVDFTKYKESKAYQEARANEVAILNKEWDEKIAKADSQKKKDDLKAKKKKAVARRQKQLARIDSDLEDMWALVRGTFIDNPREDTSNVVRRIGKSTREMATVANLGNVVMGSMSDIVAASVAHGLAPVMKDSLAPLVRYLVDPSTRKGMKKIIKSLNLAGLGEEQFTNYRVSQLVGTADNQYLEGTVAERAISAMGGLFGPVSGMNTWNNFMQLTTSLIPHQKLMRMAQKGKATKKELQFLNRIGLDESDLKKIKREFDLSGEKQGGFLIDNSSSWSDKALADKFSQALLASSREIILGKNIEASPIFGESVLGKFFLQFTTHVMSSNTMLLGAGLQRGDRQFIEGVIGLTAAGIMVNYIRDVSSGKEISDDWRVHLYGGVERSGLFSLLMYLNQTAAEPLGLGVSNVFEDEEAAKRAQYARSGQQMVLGPAGELINDAMKSAKGLADIIKEGETSPSNIASFRDLWALQTNVLFSPAYDRMEKGLTNKFGKEQ